MEVGSIARQLLTGQQLDGCKEKGKYGEYPASAIFEKLPTVRHTFSGVPQNPKPV